MPNQEKELELYRKLYAVLFSKADEALTQLEKATEPGLDLLGIHRAKEILSEALQTAEETYLNAEI